MISRKWKLLISLIWGLSVPAFAVDFYDISVATHVMRGDQNVFFSIVAMNAGMPDGDHNVSIDFNRAGVFSSPSTLSGPVSWTGSFQLVTTVDAVGGIPVNLSVQQATIGGVISQRTIFIDSTIKSFDIFLPGGPVGNAGTPFSVTITAKDALGATVLGFNDTATIKSSKGDLRVDGVGNTITFVDGVATISLEVFGTDPATHNTTLTVEADTIYLGETRVSSSRDISITPGPYEKMVLLFPGEVLTPGDLGFLAFGKDSQVIASQTSNVAVANVDVYLVDHWNNPILNPGVDVTVGFDSETPVSPADTMPASGSVKILAMGGNHAAIIGGFTMYQAALHTIRAYDVAHPTRESRSSPTVLAGAPSQLEFLNGSISNQRAGVSFNIYARIHDGTPAKNDTSINADVTLRLTNCAGTVYSDKAVDARSSVVGLQSMVHFSGGFLGGGSSPGFGESVTVYLKPGVPTVCLELDGGAGLGGTVVSNPFVMQQGPNVQLLVVPDGQVITSGLYPGVNPAVPVARTVGDPTLNLKVYVVDDGWNQLNNIDGDFIPNTPVQIQMETGYIDVPAGPFPMPGTGGPCPVTGVRYRTAFPQGTGRIHGIMGGIEGYSSFLTLNPGTYNRLVFIAPGESFDPGQSDSVKAIPDGELGVTTDQSVNTPFPISVRLTDAYFNPIVYAPAGGWPTLNFAFSGGKVFPANPISPGGDIYSHNLTLTDIGPNTITVTDSTGKTVSQPITVAAGDPVRFVVTPDKDNDLAVINGGVPVEVGEGIPLYVKAYDAYGNLAKTLSGDVRIKLLETVGAVTQEVTTPGVITPSTVTFVSDPLNGGISSGTIVITYAGDKMKNGIDNLQVQAVYEPTGVHGESEKFNMKELSTWDALVMTLPGETRIKGRRDSVFKSGSPSSVFAGDDIQVTLTLVDRYGNQVDKTGDIVVSVPNPAIQSSIPLGQTLSVVGGVKSDFFMKVFTASSTVIFSTANVTGWASSSTVTVAAGGYAGVGRLLLLAPGETRIAGAQSLPGKSGIATPLQAYDITTVTLLACDAYYNLTTYTGGSLSLTSSDGFYSRNGIGLVNGVATVPNVGLRGSTPYPYNVDLTAADAGRTSLSRVSVLQPAEYQFTALPTSVVAGSTITLELTLFDPLGVPPGPKLGANNFVTITSEKTTGGASTVAIFPNTAQLADGYVKVDLFYPHVENIRLRITDSLGRNALSAPIAVLPTGLHYVMSAPPSASADSSFPLSVKLYDMTYNSSPVQDAAYQHAFNIWVTAGMGVAIGTFPVTSASMTNGDVTIDFGYSKAESIVIHASGTVAGYSISGTASTLVNAGQFVKVQTLALGETAVEGVPSPDGKDPSGAVDSVASGEIFGLEVRAVDQYWNVVKTVFSGSAKLTSHPSAELNSVSPVPFSAGVAQFTGLTLRTAGLNRVTGAHADPLAGIVSQDIYMPVTGRLYVVTSTVAIPGPTFYTGNSDSSPSFRLTLQLREFSGNVIGDIVQNFGSRVSIQPQNLAGEDLPIGNMKIILPPPVGASNSFDMPNTGFQTLTLRYRVAEDVVFKFTDTDGWSGYSDTFQIFPQNVRYEAVFPSSATVGPLGFSMTVMAVDTETNLPAKNWTDDVGIERISPVGGPITGVLPVTLVHLSTGPYTVLQTVNQAGLFKFRLDGAVGPVSETTNTIFMNPGPLAKMTTDLSATLEPIEGVTYSVNVTLEDGYENHMPSLPVTFSLSDASFGTLSTLTGITGWDGQSSTVYTPNLQKSGQCEFLVVSGTTRLRQFFRLLGPPTTTLSFGGRAVENTNGFNLKPDDPLRLTPEVEQGMTLTGICYTLDQGILTCGPGPFLSFNIPEPGIHHLAYYSVAQAITVHTETTKTSKTFYVSAVTTPEEGLVNYPNPFRAGVDLSFLEYHLVADAGVRLTIYDMLGQRVYERSYSQGEAGGLSGLNRISWDGRNDDGVVVGNGGYVAVLEGADGTKLKRKIAVKK